MNPPPTYPNGKPFLLNPETAPPTPTTPTYPHARTIITDSNLTIYISGIAALDPHTGTVAGATLQSDGSYILDIRAQTSACLRTIDAIVQGASQGRGSVANLVDAVVYVTDMQKYYAGMNEEWNLVFGSREVAPARATVGVSELPDPRFVVEVKGVAVVESEK